MSAASQYYRDFTAQQSAGQFHAMAEMMEKQHHDLSFLGRRTWAPRPMSEATEIFDTDDESEEYEDSEVRRNSTPRSMQSLDSGSVSTASTRDLPSPPETAGLGGFEFHFDEKPVKIVDEPHVYDQSDEDDLDFIPDMSPIRPEEGSAGCHQINDHVSRPFPIQRTISTLPQAVSELDKTKVRSWTPAQVAAWMQKSGFEDSLVAKFVQNDISGTVLVDLETEDLKELDIVSFGHRHRVMSTIQQLRSQAGSVEPPSRPASRSPADRQPRALQRTVSPQEAKILVYQTENGRQASSRSRGSSRRRQKAFDDTISPLESVSIVAIEQLLPKAHKCEKGENCSKWRKQQRKVRRYMEEFTRYDHAIGDPAQNPTTAHSPLSRPKSDAEPSTVGSSDVLGPSRPDFALKIQELESRDRQESIRQFLNFQHLCKDPSPPPAPSASFRPQSPLRLQSAPALTEQLRTLPKLTIPSEGYNNDRTPIAVKHPSFGGPNYYLGLQSQLLAQLRRDPYHYGGVASPADIYRQGTPATLADLGVTTYPSDILDRDVTQSVPPDMRFGETEPSVPVKHVHTHLNMDPIARAASVQPAASTSFSHVDPIARAASVQPTTTTNVASPPRNPSRSLSMRHRPRQHSYTPSIAPVTEDPTPIHPPPTNTTTTTAKPLTAIRRHTEQPLPTRLSDVKHSGWLRKRTKTPILRRHEWNDQYWRLTGTQLAMHESSAPTARQLDRIDVEEYAIACSSLATNSKLGAAFKKSLLGCSYKADLEGAAAGKADHAYAFSLIPDADQKIAASSGTGLLSASSLSAKDGKSHHFAVQTRDERIEWMRDLMLAKALKRAGAGEKGREVRMDGNMI